MNELEQFYQDAIEAWRKNKGIGTLLLAPTTDYRPIILGILQRMYEKNHDTITTIITHDFESRTNIIDYITSSPDKENNAEVKQLIRSKHIKVFTEDFVAKYDCFNNSTLLIVCGITAMTDRIRGFIERNKFKLVLLNKSFSSNAQMVELYNSCQLLKGFTQQEIQEVRSSTPVEEIRYAIDITNEEKLAELKKCNDYINQTITIFGSFELMEQARTGNSKLNISANVICKQIAEENGWNENLNMDLNINKEIDAMFNPINLKERAATTYNIIRERAKILTDCEDKLDKILEILNELEFLDVNKILIISKRAEFASEITEYINMNYPNIICANYHDKVENIPATTDSGDPIFIKSGEHKGERKYYSSKSQKTQNQRLFNAGRLRVLSANCSPDKELEVPIQAVIITSPMCDTIEEYIYRLGNVTFNRPLKLYTLYCKDSLEEKQMLNKPIGKHRTIVNNCEINTTFDENLGAVFVD